MKPPLHIVTDADTPAPTETVAERIQRLQAEVRALGREQAQAMRQQVLDAAAAACEVAMNPAQPAGIRQLAEKMVRDGQSLVLTLDALIGRGG